jgi:selenocysteine lyase/cysteine desulfurase
LRRQFVLRDDEAFLNTGTLGSPPRVVLDAVADGHRELAATIAEWDYKPDRPNWFTGYYPEDGVRRKLAGVIHAREHAEIALLQNATMGMNTIAHGLDLQPGDEVLQTDQEHPGSESVWKLRARRGGVVWTTVKMPVPANDPGQIVDLVRNAISPRTKVIAWPHITSALGVVHPVGPICALARERGLFSVLDGAQAIGQIPIDVQDLGCDAYFGSPHKWLLAPAGNGFLYLRREAAAGVWTTLASSEWANEKDPGFRLQQRGTGNLPLLRGLEAAVDFFERVGAARWYGRIRELGDRLRAGLARIEGVAIHSSTHPAMCAGMTTWHVAGRTAVEMQDHFWREARLRVRALNDSWGVRTSTAIYNSEREIDRLLEHAAKLARQPA